MEVVVEYLMKMTLEKMMLEAAVVEITEVEVIVEAINCCYYCLLVLAISQFM